MASSVDLSFYEHRVGRVIFDLARSWIAIVAAIALALRFPHPAVLALAAIAVATQQYALQILNHDAQHRTLFSTKERTDNLSRLLVFYPLFTALKPFRKKHLDHHRWLGTKEDPDRYYYTTADKGTWILFLGFLSGVKAAVAGIARAARKSAAAQGPKEPRDGVTTLDWCLVLVVQAGIAALLAFLGNAWYFYFVLWFFPFVLVFIAQSIRSFCEHASPEPDSTADAHRLMTFRSNWLERIFLAPNNMNFHAEHHLYPQVPYYHLPALRKRLEETGELVAAGVEYRGTYLGFVWRYWRALPIQTVAVPATVA